MHWREKAGMTLLPDVSMLFLSHISLITLSLHAAEMAYIREPFDPKKSRYNAPPFAYLYDDEPFKGGLGNINGCTRIGVACVGWAEPTDASITCPPTHGSALSSWCPGTASRRLIHLARVKAPLHE